MAESRITLEDIKGHVEELRRTNVPQMGIVDYDAAMERLKAENKHLRSLSAALEAKVASLQGHLALRVSMDSEYVPYHDYEDR